MVGPDVRIAVKAEDDLERAARDPLLVNDAVG